jgi:ketosteroid isomerase-like protein
MLNMTEQEKLEQENEQTVRGLYKAYLSHDIATVIDACSEDSEWFAMGPPGKLPYAGSFRGHREIEKYIAILDDVEESNHLVAQEFIARGDKVIVLGEYIARVNSTGVQFKTDFAHIFTVRDGKVAAFRYLYDTAAAMIAYHGG